MTLEEGGDFYRCYAAVIQRFYREELKELEEETNLLMTMRRGHLLLCKNQFFLLMFILLMGPFIAYDLIHIANSTLIAGKIPLKVWAGPLVFALFPLLTLLILFLTPDRFDPLIPRRARILLGFRPFIRILPLDITR